MFRQIDRLFRDVEDEFFEDAFEKGQSIVPQIEKFAEQHKIKLDKGWKVEIARSVKQQLQNSKGNVVPDEYIEKWIQLFNNFNQ